MAAKAQAGYNMEKGAIDQGWLLTAMVIHKTAICDVTKVIEWMKTGAQQYATKYTVQMLFAIYSA